MKELFWTLFDIWNMIMEMAWPITIVILLVLLCRIFVGKVSKQASYFLWIIVAIRLMIPVMPESGLSIFNFADNAFFQTNIIVNEEMMMPELPQQENNSMVYQNPAETLEVYDSTTDISQETITNNSNQTHQNITESNTLIITDIDTKSGILFPAEVMFVIWLIGMTVMSCYGVISYLVMKYKLRFATTSDRKIYEAEQVTSPFVFGIIIPRIYLPYHLSEEERDYILRHEHYHIKRKDYLVKILAFVLLSVYWFHPFVWVAFYMMSRDMELSCDEQILKELGLTERKAYSTLLLSFASQKRFPLPSPVSFGENDIKSRIKSILNYRKPTFWSLVVMFALIVALVAGCLTDAKSGNSTNDTANETEMTDDAVAEMAENLSAIESPYIGDIVTNGKILNVLFETLGLEKGRGGMELQTRMEPYWLTVSFLEEPATNKMWQASAMYLALVGNANEVRWNYYDENSTMHTDYVTTELINSQLGNIDIKSYAASEEKIAELWKLLDEIRKKTMPDPNDGTSPLVLSTSWDKYAVNAGMDFTERIEWENRLITDDILYRGDKGDVKTCIYNDFDHNGIYDCIVVTLNKNWEDNVGNRFHIYMNNEPVFSYDLDYTGVYWDATVVDIDNDGYLEFLFAGDSGGTGGFGFNALFELLKYKNGSFEKMPLPLDSYCEWEDETTGFGIDVYTERGEGYYIAFFPALHQKVYFSIGSSKNDVFDNDTPVNTLVGHEYYGFYELTPVMQDRHYYLLAKEMIYRTTIQGYNEAIGTAYFLLDWDDTAGWVVESYDVLPYSYDDTISDEAIFDRMLRELSFYPLSYDDIMKDPTLSAIDKEHYIIKDNSGFNSLQNFATYESGEGNGYAGNKIVYASVYGSDAPVYHYIYHHTDGRYFYLEASVDKIKASYDADVAREAYVRLKTEIYADCIYNCLDGNDGISTVFYYLVEEGVTAKDILESMLSSQYPPPLDFVCIYKKEMDVEEQRLYKAYQ
ncbi:MAG: DUF4825 domain-containing protein [Lachnospiraceae bacterium]|nr:DUF4825 domain-containing protein [Lachnospiraceae bacterium]